MLVAGPDDGVGIVIHYNGDVLVTLTVAGFIDTNVDLSDVYGL
jgi:hypothetical protein